MVLLPWMLPVVSRFAPVIPVRRELDSEAVGSGNQRGLREQATCTSVPSSLPTLKAFDPRAEVDTSHTTGKYLVSAPSAITAYLESHFRRALTDDERKTIVFLSLCLSCRP